MAKNKEAKNTKMSNSLIESLHLLPNYVLIFAILEDFKAPPYMGKVEKVSYLNALDHKGNIIETNITPGDGVIFVLDNKTCIIEGNFMVIPVGNILAIVDQPIDFNQIYSDLVKETSVTSVNNDRSTHNNTLKIISILFFSFVTILTILFWILR